MAVPKRKNSSARRDERRSNVWKLQAPSLSVCPNCKELKASHCVCKACGVYNKRVVLKVGEKA